MTRFEQEISGKLDIEVSARTGEENNHFWEEMAKKEVKESVEKAQTEAVVDCNGAISWKSNGAYLMDDFCEKLEYANYPFSRQATAEARELLKAELGEGALVIDILSGEGFIL